MKHYSWPRFWCEREGSLWLSGGYLSSAAVEYNNVVPFEKIAHIPCLALLGEPGIGKSNALKAARESLKAQLGADAEQQVFSLDLSPFGEENRLVQNLFENEQFKAWLVGSYPLHLFLDSLDEGLLRIDTLAALLANELEKYPIKRLHLRIACRTAEWPAFLELRLSQLWGEKNFKAYELAPLRAEDAREAAKSEELNVEHFLSEVESKEASPLAAKPVTLRLLLNLFKKYHRLPTTQAELYERGCLSLCEDPSGSRKATRRIGELTITQRLRVAARIAAITIFSNKANIWTASDTGEQLESDVMVSELAGSHERDTDDVTFHVTEQAIHDTLTISGLFTARGPNRLGWGHQTFAEFLAAWYLDYLQLDDKTILRLLRHSDDEDSLIVPQLYETAAWIASMRPQIFRRLMQIEPLVLLRSDVLAADETTRAELAASLLELFAEEREIDQWEIRHKYSKLKHSKLAAQLRPYIKDKQKGFLVRRVAIDIAEECQLAELLNELADIALDQSEALHTRVGAAVAVSRIEGDSSVKARMKPLALKEAGDDPNLELKGYGLISVWPEHMTAEELFNCLTTPIESFYGGYKSFLNRNLTEKLQVKDLPIALRWAEQQHEGGFSYSIKDVIDNIMLKAWEHLDQPEILAAFARVALKRIKHHEDILSRFNTTDKLLAMRQETDKRRKVWKQIFPLLAEQKDLIWIGFSKVLSLHGDDVSWLIEEFFEADDAKLKQVIIGIIKDFINRWSGTAPDVLTAILSACEKSEAFKTEFDDFFKPVLFNSPQEQQTRESYEQLYGWRKKTEDQDDEEDEDKPLTPSPSQRVLLMLNKFEQGNTDAWWQLNLEMTLEPGSKFYGDELESDLTKLPGWKEANEETKERIIEGAKKYLLEGNPQTDKWIGTNTIYRPAFAGYRALFFLSQVDPRFIESLAPGIWQKWSSIIFHYPVFNGSGEETFNRHRKLIATAYRHAPGAVIDLLLAEIESTKHEQKILSLEKLEYCWDARLKGALRNKLTDENIPSILMDKLLDKLLELNDAETEAFAHSLLKLPLSEEEVLQKRAVVAAASLLQHSPDVGWQSVWPAFTSDAEFGKRVVESLSFSFKRKNLLQLTERQVADFYLWLSRQYPHKEDPNIMGVHAVGAREEIGNWRDSLLQHLKERGTPEAVNAIEGIAHELPELEWLKWTLLEAKKNVRRHRWKPLQPIQIINLARSPEIVLTAKESETTLKAKDEKSQSILTIWGQTITEIPYLEELSNSYRNDPDSFVFLLAQDYHFRFFLFGMNFSSEWLIAAIVKIN